MPANVPLTTRHLRSVRYCNRLKIFIKLEYPHVLCILMALRSNFAKLHAKGLRNFLSVGQNGPNLNVNKLK